MHNKQMKIENCSRDIYLSSFFILSTVGYYYLMLYLSWFAHSVEFKYDVLSFVHFHWVSSSYFFAYVLNVITGSIIFPPTDSEILCAISYTRVGPIYGFLVFL